MSNSEFRHIVCHPENLEVQLNNKTINPNQCIDFYFNVFKDNNKELPYRRGAFNILNVFNDIIENEPILVTALLAAQPGFWGGQTRALKSVEILLKNGSNPAVAFNYLMQPGIAEFKFEVQHGGYFG
jgi:hypothetical protein